MIDDNADGRDPLRAAFDDYQPAPRDVVPPARVEHPLDDLRALADGDGNVTVTHYEMTPEGVTRHVERVGIGAPFTGEAHQ
jgi:hypothetical protein